MNYTCEDCDCLFSDTDQNRSEQRDGQCPACNSERIREREPCLSLRTLEEALQDKSENTRLTRGDRWLYWSEDTQEWYVCERGRYAKKTRLKYVGESLPGAVTALMNK